MRRGAKMQKIKRFRRCFTLLELLISLALTVVLLSTLTYFYLQVSLLEKETEKVQKENFTLRYLETRLNKILPNSLAEHDIKKEFLFFTSGDLQGLLAPQNPSLVFLFDNGVSLDPKRANRVLGRLYLDRDRNLTLATWPLPSKWEKEANAPSVQREILMTQIESISFQFFVPPERDRKLIQDNIPNESSKPTTPPPNPKEKEKGKEQPKEPSKGAPKEKEKNRSAAQPPEQTQEAIVEPPVKGDWIGEWKKEYGYLPPLMRVVLNRKSEDGKETTSLKYTLPLYHSQKLIIYEQ